jgi:hypothetical protein
VRKLHYNLITQWWAARKVQILAARELLLWVLLKDTQVATVEISTACQSQDSNWVTHR